MKRVSGSVRHCAQVAVLLLVSLAIASCSQKMTPNRLRLVNALPSKATLEVRDFKSGKAAGDLVWKAELGFGGVEEYREIGRGTYELICRENGREIARRELVLGSGDWYTVVVAGLPVREGGDDHPALWARLQQFFEGEEAAPVNRMLPRWTILRDRVRGATDRACIRFANFAPGEGPFSVHTEGKTLTKRLSFPEKGGQMMLNPGNYPLRVMQHGREIAAGELNARGGMLYSGLIIGAVAPAREPRLILLENRTRKYSSKG